MLKQRVLLGMSGGIDSTLAIHSLQELDYEVIGLTLDMSLKSSEQVIKKAINLAAYFNIEHHVADISKEFKNEIIAYFTNEYLNGRTPSPCVKCNDKIKMRYLFELAKVYNCTKIATGHYVNLIKEKGIYYISKAVDKQKDQSYFLWHLNQNVLSKCVFPLGNLRKSEIKQKANTLGLNTLANTAESMGICFLEGKNYRDFIDEQFPKLRANLQNGKIVNAEGEIIGTHEGYPYYTIGQKRNLNLHKNISGQYVADIDAENNRLTCLPKHKITRKELLSDDFYFNDPDFIKSRQKVAIRIRGFDYRSAVYGTVSLKDNKLKVVADEPLWAVTPGQPMVFYIGDKVVGGAFV